MNDLIVVEKAAEWQRLKALVLDSVSSPITRRVYNMALDEFIEWYGQEPRPGFSKATVSAWRASLEARGLGSSSIIIRMSAIRKLAGEAADNGLLAPELAAGIARVKSAKTKGVRTGNWLSLRQAQALLGTPDATTTKGLRDRAILAVLLGCGLRRSEVAALTFAHVQQRDGRWYLSAIDHVLDVKHNAGEETGWQRFRGMVKRLATAFALAVPREETREIAPHLAFFQRVVAMIRKRLADEAGPTPGAGGPASGSRDIDAAVRQVIGGAVDAGEVIDLFAAAGLDAARLDILSDEFLERVSALQQRNLALETLRKLLNDQIKISERTNLVQAQKFREALEKAMLGYTNKQISTAQMIAQLLELAKWVRESKRHGEELGLSNEETAFYDALAENGSAKEVMKSDQLRLMARELAEMVRKMPKLDWTQRESVRADLRRKVRRLLAIYGYPPDLSEDATQLVLKQAELSTEYAE